MIHLDAEETEIFRFPDGSTLRVPVELADVLRDALSREVPEQHSETNTAQASRPTRSVLDGIAQILEDPGEPSKSTPLSTDDREKLQ